MFSTGMNWKSTQNNKNRTEEDKLKLKRKQLVRDWPENITILLVHMLYQEYLTHHINRMLFDLIFLYHILKSKSKFAVSYLTV